MPSGVLTAAPLIRVTGTVQGRDTPRSTTHRQRRREERAPQLLMARLGVKVKRDNNTPPSSLQDIRNSERVHGLIKVGGSQGGDRALANGEKAEEGLEDRVIG